MVRLNHIRAKFIMSTEFELLTSTPRANAKCMFAVRRLMEILASLAPSLSGVTGLFNGYGRIYVDCGGHLELAIAECDSPYQLALIVERQQRLVAKALAQLRSEGHELLLANNNHSGLLQNNCPIWGTHENYLTEQHPKEFAHQILPFLCTRIYGGAGGIEYPTGNFLAAVRPLWMELATGGGTTHQRAIHSTAREEHHMGRSPNLFRYHCILGDGHKAQYNLALQFGCTALALKAIFYDEQLRDEIRDLSELPPSTNWVTLLRRLNVLARPEQSLAVDPLVFRVQRIYLDAARRYAESLPDPPKWIARMLCDWEETLAAMARTDRSWLAARLDNFAKYEFYSSVLEQAALPWSSLPKHQEMFHELALLDHSYHSLGAENSVFDSLEQAGVLQHRVGDRVEPGNEPEPYVFATKSRAATRARFIRDHADEDGLIMDWAGIHDMQHNRHRTLYGPFAQEYGPWDTKGNARGH